MSGLWVLFERFLGCADENPPEGVVGVAPGVLGVLPPGVCAPCPLESSPVRVPLLLSRKSPSAQTETKHRTSCNIV